MSKSRRRRTKSRARTARAASTSPRTCAAAISARVARDIQAQIAGLTFPQGYYAEVLGEYAERQASSTPLDLLGVAAVAAIFLILMADFGSARVATLVFLTLPFALVGAIVATFLTGGVLSLGSLVGLVTVIGISARNGIMLVSHYRHLEQSEGVRSVAI